jgi:hypothetical protein
MTTTTPTVENGTADEPYTTHVEPPAQGGETYHRCRECGAELLTCLGGFDNLVHREGCSHGDRR